MNELKEKLTTEIEEADWDMLSIHHENGAVFIVADPLSLVDAAVAIVKDKTDFVKVWLDNGELARPSEKFVVEFSKKKYEKMCTFIIIQPYVLIKLHKEEKLN